jgi:hypothetical protein
VSVFVKLVSHKNGIWEETVKFLQPLFYEKYNNTVNYALSFVVKQMALDKLEKFEYLIQ